MKAAESIFDYFRRFEVFIVNRMISPDITKKDTLTFWRVRILFAILSGGLILCVFALIPSIAIVIREKLWGLGVFNVCGYVIAVTLLFSRRIRYEIRATATLSLFYATGVAIILLVGPLKGFHWGLHTVYFVHVLPSTYCFMYAPDIFF
jgi:hypothetical protein